MVQSVTRTYLWAASIENRSAALAEKLASLAAAGADLEFILCRRVGEDGSEGRVSVAPLKGDSQLKAAADAGFTRDRRVSAVRIQGPDEPGVGYLVCRAMGTEGINMRTVSAMRIGQDFVMYLTFDSDEIADSAVKRLSRPV